MKIVKDLIINEQVPLKACKPGDCIYLADRRVSGPPIMIGWVIIVKTKSIPGNKIQIKYQHKHRAWTSKNKKVHKADFRASLVVELERKADRGDTCTLLRLT